MIDERQDEYYREPSGYSSSPHFSIFIAISALNFFRVGYQLVAIAWLAVQLTGRIDAAGLVLLISTVTNLTLASALGRLADEYADKKTLMICGHLGIAFSGILPWASVCFMASDNSEIHYAVLIIALVLITVFSILTSVAMDYFIKSCIPASTRLKRLASLNVATQIALISGTGIGGAVVAAADFENVFLFISLVAITVATLCRYCLPRLLVLPAKYLPSKKVSFFGGALLYFRYPTLFSVATCSALVFSIGQITNTLLPALIKFHLHRNSVSYSLVEAAWSIGAFCISALFAGRIRQSMGRNVQDLGLVAIMVILLAVVPQFPSFGLLLSLHFLLGVGFALVRIRSEVRFLALCPMTMLGRFRANGLCLTSVIGLIVFSAPLLFRTLSIPMLYGLLAGMVLACVIAVFVFVEMRHPSHLSDEFRENR
ncbi:MAG TPA: MFS transporter [Herbaspirillum sp.]|jgi:MFS family permease